MGYRHTCPVAAVVVVESLLLLETPRLERAAKLVTVGKTWIDREGDETNDGYYFFFEKGEQSLVSWTRCCL